MGVCERRDKIGDERVDAAMDMAGRDAGAFANKEGSMPLQDRVRNDMTTIEQIEGLPKKNINKP